MEVGEYFFEYVFKDGCEVKGYTWRRLIDIVSSETGEMRKCYGFS